MKKSLGRILPLLALVVTVAAWADEPEVRITLRPDVVGVGEPAELKIEAVGADGVPAPRPQFELENLRIVGGPSRHESISIVNGVVSRSIGVAWYLAPEAAGTARVHSVRVALDNDEVALPDQQIEVTTEPQRRSRQRGRSRDPFQGIFRDFFGPREEQPFEKPQILLEATVSPRQPFRGQQHTYSLFLLVERTQPGTGRAQVDSILPQIPAFKGFWSQEIELPSQVRPEVVERNGRQFWRQPVLRRALFAFQAGEQILPPAEAELRVAYLRPWRFGEPPMQPESLSRKSNPVTITVRELPDSASGTFVGGVGSFRLEGQLEPAELEAGETARLTLRIAGDGNLDGLPDPELPELAGLTIFPPEETREWSRRGNRVEGERIWTFTLVPEQPGSWHFPALQWTFFDPTSEEYSQLATAAATLTAIGPPGDPLTPAQSVAQGGAATAPSSPVTATTPTASWLAMSPRLVTWGGSAGAAILVAMLALRSVRRRPRPDRALIAHLDRAFQTEHPRRCATAAEEAWRAFLEQRWDIHPGVPSTEWTHLLRARGASDDAATGVSDLMDDLHYLRYAPKLADVDRLREELGRRSRRLARSLA